MKSGFNKIINNILKNKTGSVVAKSPLSKYFTLGIVGISAFLIIIVVIITIIFAPIMMAQQYVEDVKNDISLFFEKLGNAITLNGWCSDTDGSCQRNAEQKYYEQLDDTYRKYKEDGVEIDTQLITGTIFYGSTLSDDKFQNEDVDTSNDSELVDAADVHLGDVKTLAKNMVSGRSIDYAKYRKYLVDTYIPKRFDDMYTEADKEKAIQNIADEIMSFASGKGSGPDSYFASLGIECSTISLKDTRTGEISVHDLEEYVAGVVSAENQYGIETSKMQAIAARTVAVARCNEVIENSTNVQVYTKPTEAGKQAAEDTKGLILSYNGKPLTKDEIAFASYPQEYWSDKHLNDGFPAWYQRGAKCGAVTCKTGSDGRTWCSTTIFRLPNLESYTLEMPNTTTSGGYWNNLSLNNQSGHCYGVSQVASRYYESELNYSYEKMIKIFFSDGVEIVSLGNGFAEGGTLVAYNNNKYVTRTVQPEPGNQHFFSNENYSYGGGFTGQCTWYAFGRANEVLKTVGSDLKWTIWSDAGQWYNQNIQMGTNAFEYSSDATKPRPGSIIVWGQTGLWGHVAFVEKVNGDGTLDFTEANIGGVRSASNPYGWQYVANQTYEQVRTRWASSGYYFQGYIYMLK